MPREWTPTDLDNLIKGYEAGKSCKALADEFGTNKNDTRRELIRAGITMRPKSCGINAHFAGLTVEQRSEQAKANAAKRRYVDLRWHPVEPAQLIQAYSDGVSVKALADAEGVSRAAMAAFLTRTGVVPRDRSAAMFTRMAATSPEERARLTEAAHAAVRGRTVPTHQLIAAARGRAAAAHVVSEYERTLIEWLADLDPVPQAAIGPYNVDIALDSIAVEVFGGNWHAFGRHAARNPERSRYILNAGWTLVVVWVVPEYPLQPAVADYLHALTEQARSDPSLRGQYRVVRGDGKDFTARYTDVDQLARVPPRGRRLNRRA